MKAIAICKPGTRYRDIGDVITKHVHPFGFQVVKSYCGHGICDLFHCAPSIPHYAHNKAVGVMKVRPAFGNLNCKCYCGSCQVMLCFNVDWFV